MPPQVVFLAATFRLLFPVFGQNAPSAAIPTSSSRGTITVSAPTERTIGGAASRAGPSQFQEPERPISPELEKQKAYAATQALGRRYSGTVLFVPQPNPKAEEITPSFNRQFTISTPASGFEPQSGVKPPRVLPFAPPGPPPPQLYIDRSNLISGDSGNLVAPADLQLAVGTRFVLQVDNTNLTVWNKDTSELTGRLDLSTQVFKLPGGLNAGDPWIEYDNLTHRWFLSAIILDASGTDYLEFAISSPEQKGSWDPVNSSWTFRKIHFANEATEFHDQPKFSVTDDKIVLAWDELSSSPTPDGGNWMVLSKQELLDEQSEIGAAPIYASANKCLSEPIPAKNLVPGESAIIISSTRPDAEGSCNGMIPAPPGYTGNLLTTIRVSGPPSNVTATTSLWPVQPYSAPRNAVQTGSSQVLFSGDSRIISAIRSGNRLFLASNDSCVVSDACFRFVDLDLASTPQQILASGQAVYKPLEDLDVGIANRYLLYPALAVDQRGDVLATSSQIPERGFLGTAVFVRLAGHEQTADWGIKTATQGTSPIACPQGAPWPQDVTRVGDYAGADTDPDDPNWVWLTSTIPAAATLGNNELFPPRSCPQASQIGHVTVK